MKLTDLAMAFQCAFRTAGSIPLRPAALCALSPGPYRRLGGSGTYTRAVGGPFDSNWNAQGRAPWGEGNNRGNTPLGLLTETLLPWEAKCEPPEKTITRSELFGGGNFCRVFDKVTTGHA